MMDSSPRQTDFILYIFKSAELREESVIRKIRITARLKEEKN